MAKSLFTDLNVFSVKIMSTVQNDQGEFQNTITSTIQVRGFFGSVPSFGKQDPDVNPATVLSNRLYLLSVDLTASLKEGDYIYDSTGTLQLFQITAFIDPIISPAISNQTKYVICEVERANSSQF